MCVPGSGIFWELTVGKRVGLYTQLMVGFVGNKCPFIVLKFQFIVSHNKPTIAYQSQKFNFRNCIFHMINLHVGSSSFLFCCLHSGKNKPLWGCCVAFSVENFFWLCRSKNPNFTWKHEKMLLNNKMDTISPSNELFHEILMFHISFENLS